MQLLTIETTGASASVALSDREGNMILEISSERMNHLQNLMTMIQSVLKKRSLQIGDVTAIAVSEGPGSFTGIRIGVSAARAPPDAGYTRTLPVLDYRQAGKQMHCRFSKTFGFDAVRA